MTRIRGVCLCLVLTGFAAMPLVGCGGMKERNAVQYPMQPGASVPGATGRISVQQTDQNNQALRIHVAHLPPPGQLNPSLSTFVVWGTVPGEPAQAMNLGQIAIGRDREGTLKIMTPYPNLDVKVTAESSPTPNRPSDYVVLKGQVMGGAIR